MPLCIAASVKHSFDLPLINDYNICVRLRCDRGVLLSKINENTTEIMPRRIVANFSHIVEDLITSLRQCYTLLIVTHNLAQAKRIADQVALFWVQSGVGQLIELGSVQQIFEYPQHPLTAAYVTGARG
ncbi:hypothetical protein [Nostoc sp. 'Lobaria pulmonaria (5183) cyanobiont']|uniref:hypothetical protein n=1 Tax=Nostoc sp. 'Lobaria pulmonaria (5183) cyanobiont' TaxID=1618022 RepID=UPI0018F88B49|nr:hypothetical protein [Nostoc sp. 'Lobaria pulmonaria (5183) cyanobiont']